MLDLNFEDNDIQYGGGYVGKGNYGGISTVYIGTPGQKGHGIGSFLGGLFRRILPLLKSGAKTVGKEALRSGMNIATDVMDYDVPIKEAAKYRLRESGMNLKKKAEEKIDSLMSGSGYKMGKKSRASHSTRSRGRSKTKKKSLKNKKSKVGARKNKRRKVPKKRKTQKKLRTVADIFS